MLHLTADRLEYLIIEGLVAVCHNTGKLVILFPMFVLPFEDSGFERLELFLLFFVLHHMSVEQVYKFFLHFIVYLAVSCKGTASLGMSRHRGYQIGVLHLLIEVPDEGLACSMACGDLPKRTCLVLSGLGVQSANHTVYTNVFEDALDHLVVHGLREAWQQGIIKIDVS